MHPFPCSDAWRGNSSLTAFWCAYILTHFFTFIAVKRGIGLSWTHQGLLTVQKLLPRCELMFYSTDAKAQRYCNSISASLAKSCMVCERTELWSVLCAMFHFWSQVISAVPSAVFLVIKLHYSCWGTKWTNWLRLCTPCIKYKRFFLGLEYDITELKSLVLKYIILMIFCFKFILSEESETKT